MAFCNKSLGFNILVKSPVNSPIKYSYFVIQTSDIERTAFLVSRQFSDFFLHPNKHNRIISIVDIFYSETLKTRLEKTTNIFILDVIDAFSAHQEGGKIIRIAQKRYEDTL